MKCSISSSNLPLLIQSSSFPQRELCLRVKTLGASLFAAKRIPFLASMNSQIQRKKSYIYTSKTRPKWAENMKNNSRLCHAIATISALRPRPHRNITSKSKGKSYIYTPRKLGQNRLKKWKIILGCVVRS